MQFPREAGILLHPTSLPGPFGIGEIGEQAFRFVDFMASCGVRLWQILPLGPTGYGNSPYQTLSAFAGNHLLISLEELVHEGLLRQEHLTPLTTLSADRVDFGRLIPLKEEALKQAYNTFRSKPFPRLQTEFETFCHHQASWLEDYAFFRALKNHFGGVIWTEWPDELIHRKPQALRRWQDELAPAIDAIRFEQFLFFKQWSSVKAHANGKHIKIIGDIPIFIAHDSADVWANQELFFLDNSGNPSLVAGVPPDYFSATGQRWGNPLYRWEVMKQQDYQWWIERFRATFQLVDIVRLDHFRGFEAYWEVPAHEETAINGRWVPGPGAPFFEAVEQKLGKLPIIAEDLGVITPEVVALRERFEYPGMRVLQFAFGTDEGSKFFLPHNYPRNCVVYTGTHDNDTCVGWFTSESWNHTTLSPEAIRRERERALQYMGSTGEEIHWDFIRLAFASVANTAITPLQDVLGLGSEARMNLPGRPDGNWEWRFRAAMLTDGIQQRLGEFIDLYQRDGRYYAP